MTSLVTRISSVLSKDGLRKQLALTVRQARLNKNQYLFLVPFGLIFIVFTLMPVLISFGLSFTYFNILEPPKWVGLKNYLKLFLTDDVFVNAIRNTFILAAITGPIGYISSFLFAWFINELPAKVRAFLTLVFYAPTISGNAYMIWTVMFSGDSYGYVNGFLMRFGLTRDPVQWLQDPKHMMNVIIIIVLWMSLGTGFLAFIAGLQNIDPVLFEVGYIEGIRNRWQELWFITLPSMKEMLMFGAVMSITQSFAVGDVTQTLAGFPSTDYAAHTVVNHLVDYGTLRFEMGYASAIATILFIAMVGSNKFIQKQLRKVGR